jgi:hypothetical protein
MEYQIVGASVVSYLVDIVRRLVADGWESQGGIAVDSEGTWYQAMIRRPKGE